MKAKRMKCELCARRRMCSGRPLLCRVCIKLMRPDEMLRAIRAIRKRVEKLLTKD